MTYTQATNKLAELLGKRNTIVKQQGWDSNRLPDLNHAIGICEKLQSLTKETEFLQDKLKKMEL